MLAALALREYALSALQMHFLGTSRSIAFLHF